MRKSVAAENAIGERDGRLLQALASFVTEMKRTSSPVSLDQARKRLGLDQLRREAARTDDSTAAIAAQRALERTFTQMAFYVPRDFFDDRRYAHAAGALQIARLIKPTDGGACLWQARALAQTGDKAGALQALECAAASKQVTAAAIEGDTLLAPLHGESRYQAVVRQIAGER